MKKLIALMLALCLLSGMALCEEDVPDENDDTANFVHSLYDTEEETVFDTEGTFRIDVSDLFSIDIPGSWTAYDVTETQADKGIFACFGDGEHFMFIDWKEDTGDYADATEYAMTLGMNDRYASIFVSQMGEGEFAFFTDYEFFSSDCATIIKGKGIYTFYFYPIDGNRDFAQKVIHTMKSFRYIEQEGQ